MIKFNKNTFTKEESNIITEMYKEGYTIESIRKRLRCRSERITDFIKEGNYEKRSRNTLKNYNTLSQSRKYCVDESYFDNIDTPTKAYWLGFLFADGYIKLKYGKNGNTKGGFIEVTLKHEDKYHLENFLYDIQSNHPIKDKTVILNEKEYKACRLVIYSVKLVNSLIKLNCIPNKSLTLQPPQDMNEILSFL